MLTNQVPLTRPSRCRGTRAPIVSASRVRSENVNDTRTDWGRLALAPRRPDSGNGTLFLVPSPTPSTGGREVHGDGSEIPGSATIQLAWNRVSDLGRVHSRFWHSPRRGRRKIALRSRGRPSVGNRRCRHRRIRSFPFQQYPAPFRSPSLYRRDLRDRSRCRELFGQMRSRSRSDGRPQSSCRKRASWPVGLE